MANIFSLKIRKQKGTTVFEILFPIFIIACIGGFGAFFWSLFEMEKFKKNLISEAERNKSTTDISSRPKTLAQYKISPDRKTFTHYYCLLDEFDRIATTGKMAITSTELVAIKNTVSSLYFPLYHTSYKMRVYFTAGLWLLMIPISFWFLVVLGALWIFAEAAKTKNFTKFESLVNQYYSPQFKEVSQIPKSNLLTSTSLSVEIQKLEDMRVKGVISDDEFSQLKKKLISA